MPSATADAAAPFPYDIQFVVYTVVADIYLDAVVAAEAASP